MDDATPHELKGVSWSLPPTGPANFLRSLLVIALVSAMAILPLSGYGIYRVMNGYILRLAGDNSVKVAEALLGSEDKWFYLRQTDDGERVVDAIPSDEIVRLDVSMREFLMPFGIIKVKIYNGNRRIIYSTDLNIIGKVDGDNPHLERALAGMNDSQIKRAATIRDLAEESKLDADVVETYVPIRSAGGGVIGSFEIYVDVTQYRRDVAGNVARAIVLIALVPLLVYGVASYFVARIARQLRDAEKLLRHMAITDPLTGLFNRRHIIARLQEEHARIKRKRSRYPEMACVGIILIDIDHFKRVNDTHGHMAGDEVLKEVARRLLASVRTYDVVGRFGGEEFIVVMPSSNAAQACITANRICSLVRSSPVVVDGKELQVTASAGVSSVCAEEDDCAAGIRKADAGLYAAKEAGRDRVMVAGPPGGTEASSS